MGFSASLAWFSDNGATWNMIGMRNEFLSIQSSVPAVMWGVVFALDTGWLSRESKG